MRLFFFICLFSPAAYAQQVILFDGSNLDQWATRGKASWRVVDGEIHGGQDGDPTRAGMLVSKEKFKDFDLSLEFKIDEHGKYNSGVYLRRSFEHKGPFYQLNIGRAAAEEYTGLYLDKWLDKGDEKDAYRLPGKWNTLRIRAVGSRIESWLNGTRIVQFNHSPPEPRLLESGHLALQTYGAEGHAGWVKFRAIRIRRLDDKGTR